jgi:hypothetical protein
MAGVAQELQALGEAVGTVSRGVPQDVIDALPNARYASRFADAAAAKGARAQHTPSLSSRMHPCAAAHRAPL